jgi:hypothetical protein
MSAIVFGRIGLDIGARKLVVFRTDRADLPHLTCSWNNPTRDVDLHLTPVSPRDNYDRESLLKIQESELMARFRDLVGQIVAVVLSNPIQLVWGVHAKWLTARGYVLLGPTSEPVSEWFQRALSKRRGKYRLDERVFKQMPKIGVYRPTAREFAKLGQDGQMHAVCMKGLQRRTVLMLARLDFAPSNATWVAFDFADLSSLVKTFQRRRVIPQWFASFAPGAWERIHAALQLHELER